MTRPSADRREPYSRHPENLILSPHDFPRVLNAALNPAAMVRDSWTLLLLRTEQRTGMSSPAVAPSENGVDHCELARGDEWVFGPQEPYERIGDVGNVVFPGGWILRDDGETLHLYHGAAGSVVCAAEASLASPLAHPEEPSDPLAAAAR